MGKTLKFEQKAETKVEVFDRIAKNAGPLSRKKVFKMRDKMINAFKELKESQRRLKSEHDSLVFAQQEMKIWQDNYLKLFNLTNVGYFTVYKDLIVKEVNEAGIGMLGYDKFEIIGQPIIVHAESQMRDNMRNYYIKVFEEGSASIELKLISGNDKPIEVLIHSSVITDEREPVPCCVSAVVNAGEINKMKKMLESYQIKIDKLTDKHTKELDTVLQKHQDQLEIYKQDKEKWENGKAEVDNHISNQIDEIERLKQLNNQIQQDLENVCLVKDKFQSKCDDYESMVKEQAFELASLKGQLDKALEDKGRFDDLQMEYENQQRAKEEIENQYKEKISSLENDAVEFEGIRNQLDGRITVLQQQIKDMEAKGELDKQKLATMVRQRSRKIKELVERIERIKSESGGVIDDLQNRLDDTERVLGGRVNELKIVNEKLEEQVSRAREDAQVHRGKANRLEKLLLQSQSEFSAAQKEIDLRGEQLKDKAKEWTAERDELVSKLSAKSDEFDMLNEVYQQQQIDIENLKSKLEAANESFRIQVSNNDRLSSIVAQNRMMLQRLCDVGAITMNVYNLAERKMAYVNRHIGEVLGYSKEQIEDFGDDIVSKLMHPDDLSRISNDLAGFSWDSNDDVLDIEYRLQDVTGSWRYIHSQEAVLSIDEAGKPLEVLGIQYDYTEKMQAKEGMKALAKIVALVGKS